MRRLKIALAAAIAFGMFMLVMLIIFSFTTGDSIGMTLGIDAVFALALFALIYLFKKLIRSIQATSAKMPMNAVAPKNIFVPQEVPVEVNAQVINEVPPQVTYEAPPYVAQEPIINEVPRQAINNVPYYAAQEPINRRDGHEIDYVTVISSHTKTKSGSAVARGVVGSALLGPVGLLAAAGAKKNEFVTLVIHYKNGKTKTKRVNTKSYEFRKYARFIQ